MTQEFFLGQLRLILVGVIAYAAGRGWLTPADSGFATAILTPAGALIGPWIWSLYVNVGKKLVPKNSVAISADNIATAANPVGATALVTSSDPNDSRTIAAKVVGCFLAALALSSLAALMLSALISPALAQAPQFPRPRPAITGNVVDDVKNVFAPAPSTAATSTGNSLFDSAFTKLSQRIQEVAKDVTDKAIADVSAALDDATKRNDQISMPCWQAHLDFFKLLPNQWENPPEFRGIALSIQIQRDLLNAITGTDKGSLKVACAALYGDQLALIGRLGLLFGLPL